MTDLTERLRKGRLVRTSQMMTCRLNGLPIEVATGEVRELCHPDALEAATTLETLTQENARLREAIKQALDAPMINHNDSSRSVYGILRKALGGGDE